LLLGAFASEQIFLKNCIIHQVTTICNINFFLCNFISLSLTVGKHSLCLVLLGHGWNVYINFIKLLCSSSEDQLANGNWFISNLTGVATDNIYKTENQLTVN